MSCCYFLYFLIFNFFISFFSFFFFFFFFFFFRTMATQLIKHDKIVTTMPKLKELKPIADKMVTWAKRGDLHARRQMYGYITEKDIVRKAFKAFPERFKERKGAHTSHH